MDSSCDADPWAEITTTIYNADGTTETVTTTPASRGVFGGFGDAPLDMDPWADISQVSE